MCEKIILAILFILTSIFSNAQQVFTKGASAQLYFDWRPDLGPDYYEFTYKTLTPASSTNHIHSNTINLYFWDDCNYGKLFMGASDTGFTNEPLHDTLFRMVPQYGLLDTFCGYDTPYMTSLPYGSTIELTISPHRKLLVYKGIVHLPEKCNQWHFVIGAYKNVCFDISERAGLMPNRVVPTDTFLRSNLNENSFYPYYMNERQSSLANSVVGVSFNNSNFPDNSSIRYLGQSAYYFPVGYDVTFNPCPYDPNHDSLEIAIIDTIKSTNWLTQWSSGIWKFFKINDSAGNPHQEVFTNNLYYAPLPGQSGPNPILYNSINNPFDTDSTFVLVDSTGETRFTAQSEMDPILYYRARDYRNGHLISESFFYNQFTIKNENRPQSYLQLDTIQMQGVYNMKSDGTMIVCNGYPVDIEGFVKLSGVGNGNLIVRTTADTTLPGNGICIVSNSNTDSVHWKLNWTPPVNAKGLYTLFVSAKDSNCDPPYNHYLQVFTLKFHVDSCQIVTSVFESVQANDIQIFPNPSNGTISISCTEPIQTIDIYSALSQPVLHQICKGNKLEKIYISQCPKGLYFIRVNNQYTKKVLVGY